MTPKERMDYILSVTPGFSTEKPCPACKGEKFVPHIGEYETLYAGNLRQCPLCCGTGQFAERLTIMQREAIAIVFYGLPEDGMLYPTITPEHLTELRQHTPENP